jgi:penicillin-binding protein 1B
LNAATVNLGMSVGIPNIIDTAHRMGITSNLSPLPSLTLGAFELSPLEVLQAYTTIASLGRRTPVSLLAKVDDLNGKNLYRFDPTHEQVVAADAAAELVGVMKQTILTGTARGVSLSGFKNPTAGKTGTTNDKKDAWFAGFTPLHTAIVWVGYDDNTSHGLTGGSGAVPIWTTYMKSYASSFPPDDFPWPEGTDRAMLTPEQLSAMGMPDKKNVEPAPVELIFKKGQVPAGVQIEAPLNPSASPPPVSN